MMFARWMKARAARRQLLGVYADRRELIAAHDAAKTYRQTQRQHRLAKRVRAITMQARDLERCVGN